MIQVSDVRQLRVYQEGVEEGIEKVAINLLKMELPIKEIAQATGLTPAQVRRLKKKQPNAGQPSE
jgi:predicted transposase YdaD